MNTTIHFIIKKRIFLAVLLLAFSYSNSAAKNYQDTIYAFYTDHIKEKIRTIQTISYNTYSYIQNNTKKGIGKLTPHAQNIVLYSKNKLYPALKHQISTGASFTHKKISNVEKKIRTNTINGGKKAFATLYHHRKELVATGISLGILGQLIQLFPTIMPYANRFYQHGTKHITPYANKFYQHGTEYIEKLYAQVFYGCNPEAYKPVPNTIKSLPINKDEAIQQWYNIQNLKLVIQQKKEWCKKNLYKYQQNLFLQNLILNALKESSQQEATDKTYTKMLIEYKQREINDLEHTINYYTDISANTELIRCQQENLKTKFRSDVLSGNDMEIKNESMTFNNTEIEIPGDSTHQQISTPAANNLSVPTIIIKDYSDFDTLIKKYTEISPLLLKQQMKLTNTRLNPKIHDYKGSVYTTLQNKILELSTI